MKRWTVLLLALLALCWVASAAAVDIAVPYNMNALPQSVRELPPLPAVAYEVPTVTRVTEKEGGVFAITFNRVIEEVASRIGATEIIFQVSSRPVDGPVSHTSDFTLSELTREGNVYDVPVGEGRVVTTVELTMSMTAGDGALKVRNYGVIAESGKVNRNGYAIRYVQNGITLVYNDYGTGELYEFSVYDEEGMASVELRFTKIKGKEGILQDYWVRALLPEDSLELTLFCGADGTLYQADFDDFAGYESYSWSIYGGWSDGAPEGLPAAYRDLSNLRVVSSLPEEPEDEEE